MTKLALTRRHIILLQAALGGGLDWLDKTQAHYADLQARRCLTEDGQITPLGVRYLRSIGRLFGIPF